MAKTQEELQALRAEFESLNIKLAKLSDEELAQVVGGGMGENSICPYGKSTADQECNFVYHGGRCQYTTPWDWSQYAYTTYICDKGCGRFDDDLRDF